MFGVKENKLGKSDKNFKWKKNTVDTWFVT